MKQADIGVVGLAVMGENLILNMESRGFTVACFNRTVNKVDHFLSGRARGKNISGAHSVEEFVGLLAKPRKVMLMVKAGAPVDAFIGQIVPLLEEGDILIDGGNSHYADTRRRAADLEARGLRYIGTGISGGEEGALTGPSIMPGGSPAAWPEVKPIFQAVAAKSATGEPCADWVGPDGAGHFVKMVHNGIEYGDMQLIAETYQLLRDLLGMTNETMAGVFAEWNGRELESYLIQITADILSFNDEQGRTLLDSILDSAGQKGTGKWAGIAALDAGIPLTLIVEAVFARSLSAVKEERRAAAAAFPRQAAAGAMKDTKELLADLEKALFAAKIVSYAQGFALLKAAATEYQWNLDYGMIAMLWSGGCIIRSAFLKNIKHAYDTKPDLPNLILDSFFKEKLRAAEGSWRRVVAAAVARGIPVPAFSAALAWFDGYRSERLPANLIQAQRDYFGAHTYERTDTPRGEFFHTNWTGHGGDTSASTYSV
ncbi:MAG TPA: decarboxylating NADP(+)-dependent phosphogluconate dehydrogenase [Spirochaetia bacterium]|nr:decarboxylating NADP(+)-dependent phosphogluconate dehydrogenase [Spirochaetia bacterium]